MKGRPLTDFEKGILKRFIPEQDLDSARLVIGDMPFWLPKQDIGLTLYNTIYLASYDPLNMADIATLGHELTHVGQYRNGLNIFSYGLSCRHGYWNSPLEKAAYAMEAKIKEALA